MSNDSASAQTKPYGAWTSPITAASLAQGAIGVSDLKVADGRLYWLENRPAEGGRLVVMRSSPVGGGGPRSGGGGMPAGDSPAGEPPSSSRTASGPPLPPTGEEITPEGFNARTRVHEYGGAPYAVAPDGIWFSHFRDQRLYRQGEGAPEAMTPEGFRYADAVAGPGGGLIAVREDHTDPDRVRNAIVRLSGKSGDAGQVLFGDADFVAYPRLSPDGARLAWIAWDFPAMPWDATRLYVADLGAGGLSNTRTVAGGDDVSAVEPQWREDGRLYWMSDESGFWNLYAEAGEGARALYPAKAEFAGPLWQLGQSNYALMPGGQIVAPERQAEGERLLVVDETAGTAREIPLPFLAFTSLKRLDATHVAMIGHSGTQSSAVIVVDIANGGFELVRRPSPAKVDPGYVSRAEAISFESAGGRTAHALFYPPQNAGFRAPDGETPPLIVQAHGGPTGAASAAFNLGIQYWTSRGFALVDVDYGGSAGYGRAYRKRLEGQWGVVDVEDVIAAARHLADTGRVDPRRIAIHGGSAGGFTVLAALSQSDVFGAGADFYGVADLAALARDTHKFESRYLDGLIGPWPAAKAVYDARSPINHLERFTAPLLILQGADDPIVPPNQAHMIRDALKGRGVPVAYLEFAGEAHGWRRADTMIRAKEAELSFYGRVFGLTPADEVAPVEIENAGALSPPP